MNVSSVSNTMRKNSFIKYSNSFFGEVSRAQDAENNSVEKTVNANTVKKSDKIKGLETLTIFPKQVIEGHTVITA